MNSLKVKRFSTPWAAGAPGDWASPPTTSTSGPKTPYWQGWAGLHHKETPVHCRAGSRVSRGLVLNFPPGPVRALLAVSPTEGAAAHCAWASGREHQIRRLIRTTGISYGGKTGRTEA